MQRHRFVILVLSALCLMVIVAGISVSDAAAQKNAASIHLKAGTFAPASGQMLPLAADLTVSPAEAAQSGYYLIQFRGNIRQEWKKTDHGDGCGFARLYSRLRVQSARDAGTSQRDFAVQARRFCGRMAARLQNERGHAA